jgi:acetyl esterase/lipase
MEKPPAAMHRNYDPVVHLVRNRTITMPLQVVYKEVTMDRKELDILSPRKLYLKRLTTIPSAFWPVVIMMALTILSCQASSLLVGEPSATPMVYADTFFSGRAFVDDNGNGQIDSSDAPLKDARFTAAGFGGLTDASGYAMIVIPGGWDQPVTAQMAPPEGSGYTLIGPTEAILQSGVQNSADFLFAAPLSTPEITETAQSISTTPTPTIQATRVSKPGAVLVNLVYCTAEDDVELTMDMYQPRKAKRLAPVVLYVHGGGWISGDKSDGAGHLFINELLRRGYFVAAVNYRLAPKYEFPAQIEDVKCAVRYLRANAAQYNLDPERIGAMGGSAGGHLVSLLGLSDENAGWDVGQYAEQSSHILAVVDMFGPSDMTKMYNEQGRRLITQVFGASGPEDPILKTSSPISYITSDDPPFLILQGEEDEVVSPSQSQLLYDELVAAGLPAQLVMVKNAGHGFRPVEGDLDPTLIELKKIVGDFFDQYLK